MKIESLSVQDYFWHVILNPNACDKTSLDSWLGLSERLSAEGVRHELHKADSLGAGMEIARQLCVSGCRHLIVIGGDGTINEVVNGIFLSGVDTREVCLAVLPLGRGNDWARTHAFPQDVNQSVEVFARGRFMAHDIGRVRCLRQGETPFERYFANIAGFCFDAEVIYDVTYNKPHFLGLSVYILSLARMLFRYKSQLLKIASEDFDYQDRTFIVVAGICQYNGGGMRQSPYAQPDDGLFDVVVIPKVSPLTVIANMNNIADGSHVRKIKKIRSFRTRKLTITANPHVRGEVEGELLPLGDYEIEVLPNALKMLTNLG